MPTKPRKTAEEKRLKKLARTRAWELANPERKRELRRLSAARHRDTERHRAREWYRNGGRAWMAAYDDERYRDPPTRMRVMAANAKRRARKIGVDFEAGLGDHLAICPPTHCTCCGKPFNFSRGREYLLDVPSLDRFDNSLVYTSANVRVICYECNSLKSDGTVAEFEAILRYMEASPHPQRLSAACGQPTQNGGRLSGE